MKLTNEINPTALRSGFVAPTAGGSVGEVCPQAGFRRVDDATKAPNQGAFLGRGDAAASMTTGYRSWSPLIT